MTQFVGAPSSSGIWINPKRDSEMGIWGPERWLRDIGRENLNLYLSTLFRLLHLLSAPQFSLLPRLQQLRSAWAAREMDPSKCIFRTASVDCTKSCLATIRPSGHGQTQRELTVHLPASNLRILITREECRQLKFIVKALWSALDHFWQWAISNWTGGANFEAFLQDSWNINLITVPF